jgi:hypothetical protein
MSALAILLPACAGMETPLYGAVLLGSFLSWHCDRKRQALLLAGILPLIRGEGILLLGVLFLAMLLERRMRQLWPTAILAFAPLICWEAF